VLDRAHAGQDAPGSLPGPDPQRADCGTFFTFSDPDGNAWLVQDVARIA
jgi:hypothetical protein